MSAYLVEIMKLNRLYHSKSEEHTHDTGLEPHSWGSTAWSTTNLQCYSRESCEAEHSGAILFTAEAVLATPLGPLIEELIVLVAQTDYLSCKKSGRTDESFRTVRLSRGTYNLS